eukprot:scaffold520_cov300-Pavlova_lutheri.AAC.5
MVELVREIDDLRLQTMRRTRNGSFQTVVGQRRSSAAIQAPCVAMHCPPVGYLCFDHCEIWAEEVPREWKTGNHEMYHKCTSATDWCETWKEDGLGWVRGYEGDAAYTRLRHPHT